MKLSLQLRVMIQFGRHFNFSMSNAMHIAELFEILGYLMSDIDKLPIHPKKITSITKTCSLNKFLRI